MNLGENSSSESPLQNCPVTTNVQIIMLHHDLDQGEEKWILQALTKNEEKKSIGGNEFYVTYTDDNAVFANSTARGESGKDEKELDPTAVAIITDLQDGTYALRFKTTPMNQHPTNLSGTGTLNIYLQYTCGICQCQVNLAGNPMDRQGKNCTLSMFRNHQSNTTKGRQ